MKQNESQLRVEGGSDCASYKPPSCEFQAHKGDRVKVHYRGKLTDGKVFDSSFERGDPIEFELGSGQAFRQSDGRWRFSSNNPESNAFAAALETLAGVISLASLELDQSLISTLNSDVGKILLVASVIE
ncbi:hypothetical protein PVK06_017817 [Gossypium arboreum]|uniref:peptidylprolyl isomerase n=1 Tax=Gossypium arboreum TaxID=29729 RepID=A0ABR0Q3P5_GOSAR|nr:hypothetical protein PVK06_017817 [Gossypium arboreum]